MPPPVSALAAPAGRHDEAGRLLAAQLLQLAHGALDTRARRVAVIGDGVGQRIGLDVEGDGQRAHVGHDLRFAGIQRLARGVGAAVGLDGHHHADGADWRSVMISSR